MRFMIKLTILGLAAYGAERLYAQLRPRVDELRGRADTELSGAVDAIKTAADDVRQDVKVAAMQVQEDVVRPARDLKDSAQGLKEAASDVL